MGCYPKGLKVSQKIAIGIGTGIAVVIIGVLLIQTVKSSRNFRFFIFYRLKVNSILYFNKHDEDNVEDKQYDAYLSYR